jgi:hypothetical protein
MQAKLDIDVRANLHSKNLVVDEAKRLGARYVVIDRLEASSIFCVILAQIYQCCGECFLLILVLVFSISYCDCGLEYAGI